MGNQASRKNPDEAEVETVVEMKTPRKIDGIIQWTTMDEKIRLARNERVRNSQKSSMWQYNPKGGMPTELTNVNPSAFLTSHLGEILCFLPRDVFVRLCSMLSVCDFLHLSLTCRFLHWRIFTFCTCYAPYTVQMSVGHKVSNDPGEAAVISQYPRHHDGRRGLFVRQPFCLRKPFFFDTLELNLNFPFYSKHYYDMCLPYITAVRGLVRHLEFIFFDPYSFQRRSFNFSDTNNFLKTINASYYENRRNTGGNYFEEWNTMDFYMNCSYARQMYRVSVVGNYYDYRGRINVPVFENSIGSYQYPRDRAIIATLKNFLAGSRNLAYHQYLNIEKDNGRFPLIEYLFQEFGEFEEFFYGPTSDYLQIYFHVWKKMVSTENEGQLRIVIKKEEGEYVASVTIGKEETFDKMDKKYTRSFLESSTWWEMKTAEPDIVEETVKAADPDVAMEPYVTLEPYEVEESDVTVVLDETEELDEAVEPVEDRDQAMESDKVEESDEIEEQQEPCRICVRQNDNSCTIQ